MESPITKSNSAISESKSTPASPKKSRASCIACKGRHSRCYDTIPCIPCQNRGLECRLARRIKRNSNFKQVYEENVRIAQQSVSFEYQSDQSPLPSPIQPRRNQTLMCITTLEYSRGDPLFTTTPILDFFTPTLSRKRRQEDEPDGDSSHEKNCTNDM